MLVAGIKIEIGLHKILNIYIWDTFLSFEFNIQVTR